MALCIWIGWVAFVRELKYLYLKKELSSYHGSFVINKDIKIEKWKNEKSFVCPTITGVKLIYCLKTSCYSIIILIEEYIWLQF